MQATVSNKPHTIFYSSSVFSLVQRCCDFLPLPKTVKRLENYCTLQTLPKASCEFHYRYIAHSGYAHKPNKQLIEPFGFNPLDPLSIKCDCTKLPFTVEYLKGCFTDKKKTLKIETAPCFFDRETGLKIVVSVNDSTKEIILAFGDANSMTAELSEKDANDTKRCHHKAVLDNLVGWSNDLGIYSRADALAMHIIQTLKTNGYGMSYTSYKDYNFILTGQSLGGSLAQYVSILNGIPSFCYNAVPLGRKLQASIGEEKLRNDSQYVTQISVSWDPTSDLPLSGITSFLINCFYARTPTNFGQRFCIPSAYYKPFDIHSYLSGSFVSFLGYSKRTLPKDLEQQNNNFLNNLNTQDKNRFHNSREYKTATKEKILLKLSEVHVQYLLRIQQDAQLDPLRWLAFGILSFLFYLIGCLIGYDSALLVSFLYVASSYFTNYLENRT